MYVGDLDVCRHMVLEIRLISDQAVPLSKSRGGTA